MVEIKKILHNKIYYYEQLDSTDLKALELAKQGAAEGTIVIAARQTAGRGRMRRKWESPEGKGLWFSMILRPTIAAEYCAQITLLTAVAAVKALQVLTDKKFSIKWPNDIYWKDKKIAGILIENSLFRDRIDTCIIGIGLNVNQEVFISNAPNPVSLRQITGNDVNREILLMEIQAELLNIYQNYSPEFIHQEYLNHLYRRNGFHRYAETAANTVFDAEVEDVLPDGRLILRTQAGEIKSYYFKEIQFVI